MNRIRTKYRRKAKESAEKREIITEPVRRSIYDVLQTNLKIAKRVSYIHRLLYVGEHNYTRSGGDIVEAMEENYALTNTGYCTEPISGIFLHYNRYFCAIVEGSEEALHKHLTLLFERADKNIDNVKLLCAIHHVKGRFWTDWMSYPGRPQERVEEIDPESNLENSMRYVKECCEKLYSFAKAFISDQLALRARVQAIEEGDEDEDAFVTPPAPKRSRSLVERDVYSDHLPEIKLLKFLIHCKYLKTMKQFHHYYEHIGQSHDYSLKSWPLPKNFIPYDVFDEVYDPISDLPPLPGEETKPEEEDETLSVHTVLTQIIPN